jgi:transcriptional regulator with PAS, ATPase and Fis domain
VGRSPDADIKVQDSAVSRIHLRLHLSATVRVEDVGSANGTLLGGSRLAPGELRTLPPGQVLEIGTTWMAIANSALASSDSSHKPKVSREITNHDDDRRKPVLVVHDEKMQALHHLVERVALSDISVMLRGETGVGKEVFARRLHELSTRASHPFVGINCAALSETLLESEVFGHERGAFTGAVQSKPGLFEMADKGTVLLDEIGEVPLTIQVKLLRVLEERQVMRLGGTKSRPFDVRVLSATNRDLEQAIEAGSFRRDLYFRLNGITLEIPPLRERMAELEPLVRRFVAEAAARKGAKRPPEVTIDAWERLRGYRWPGNIRQLRNMMERAVVLADDGPITAAALQVETYIGPTQTRPAIPDPLPPAAMSSPPPEGPDADDRRRILDALDRCAGNQTRAAEMLGISRRTLVTRLGEYSLPRPRKR